MTPNTSRMTRKQFWRWLSAHRDAKSLAVSFEFPGAVKYDVICRTSHDDLVLAVASTYSGAVKLQDKYASWMKQHKAAEAEGKGNVS